MIAEFSPTIDEGALHQGAERLRTTGVVRVPDFLDPAAAEALATSLQDDLEWNLATCLHSKAWDATPAEQEAIGLERVEAMAIAGKVDDFRYLFDVVRIDDDPRVRRERGLLIDQLAEVWHRPEVLDLWSQLCGRGRVTDLTINATRYRHGHFLTRHADAENPRRLAAFTLSLSKEWRAEWGGLLHFLGDDGDVKQSFAPSFNSLVMFHVPREHFVSAVAAYAPAPRLTISGWLMSG